MNSHLARGTRSDELQLYSECSGVLFRTLLETSGSLPVLPISSVGIMDAPQSVVTFSRQPIACARPLLSANGASTSRWHRSEKLRPLMVALCAVVRNMGCGHLRFEADTLSKQGRLCGRPCERPRLFVDWCTQRACIAWETESGGKRSSD